MMTRKILGWMLGVAMTWAATAPLRANTSTGGDRPRKETPGSLRGLATRAQAAEQLAQSFDAGDSYQAPSGKKRLLRLAGTVALQAQPEAQTRASLNELSGERGPLKHYTAHATSSKGLTLLHSPRSEGERQLRDPRLHQDTLAKVRRAAGVRTANPVFIDPETGLARLLTGEILIGLQPGTDPRAYFGSDWPGVRPLRGSPDSFILTRAGATAEAIFAEAGRRTSDRRVAWAQPNFLSQVVKQTSDPLFAAQWALNNSGLNGATPGADVKAPPAWTTTTGNPGIVIAILDDGVELTHADLVANIFSNPGEISNGADDDGNGYVDDLRGWDFVGDDSDPNPDVAEDRHGTAVAGLVAATANNNAGLAGIAHGARIMPVKIAAGANWVPDSSLAEAIYYAAGRTRNGLGTWRGADVLSLSVSFPQSAVVDAALDWAAANGRGGKGCPIFVAAGDQASRWRPTRVRLPVGAMVGAGTFLFGFEYSKDVSLATGEDLVRIDNVALLSGDGMTQVDSSLGLGGRQDFEGEFPPPGWLLQSSFASPLWLAATVGAHTGAGGQSSAQSGALANGNWTELRTPRVTLSGNEFLSFHCYVSSEAEYDGLKIWVYDIDGNYLNVFAGSRDEPFISGSPGTSPALPYPASHPAVMAVGASTDTDRRADYSAYGVGLELLAPSSGGWNDVVSTDLNGSDGYASGDYTFDFGGTSASCPLAAGVAALMLAVDPTFTAADLRGLLRESCDKIGSVPYDGGGWNQFYGYGRLNAQRAVAAARSFASSNLRLLLSASPHPAIPGGTVTLSLTVSNRGSIALSGVVVTNFLPPGLAFVSSAPAASGSPLVFNLGTLAGHASASISIVAQPQGVASFTNLAVVASATTDPDTQTLEIAVVPAVTITDSTVTEGNAGTINSVFNVQLSARSTLPVTVYYSVGDGSAVAGLDYVPVYGAILFPPGSTNQPLRVPVIGDRLSQSNLTFFVVLDGALNAGIARATAMGTILDNRDPFPVLRIDDVVVTEGDSGPRDAVFTLRLSTRSGRTITAHYEVTSGTAQAGIDFAGVPGTVTFAPGVVTETISVPITSDTLSENSETFFVTLSSPVNATMARARAKGTILDNDALPLVRVNDVPVVEGRSGLTNAVFTVSLSLPSGLPVTVGYAAAAGSATVARDFRAVSGALRFAPGVTNLTVNVPVLGDSLSESNETFFLNLTRAANANILSARGVGTILDDDELPALSINDARRAELNASALTMVFNVRLSVPSGRTVLVDYATADGTATAGSDYAATNGTLVFRPGAIVQAIRVPVLGNTISESNETFFVNLGNPVNATLTRPAAVATIVDDDRVPAIAIYDITVTEGNAGATNAVFTVRLSKPSGRSVTVSYSTSNNTARAGLDFVAGSGLVTFDPGTTNQTVTVSVLGDSVPEPTETFFLDLTRATNATLADARGLGTILDTDLAAALSLRPAGSVVGTNQLSDFRIESARIVGSNVLITFPTFSGRSIRLEYCDGPLGSTNQWLPVPGASNLTGAGESRTVTHAGGAAQTMRFYRGRLSP